MAPIRQIPEEIKSLSDQELSDELRQHNVSVGPIMPTTRSVYERKLCELWTGEQAAPTHSYEEVDDDEEEEESEDEEVVLKPQQPRQRMTRSTKPEVSQTPPRTPPTSSSSTAHVSTSPFTTRSPQPKRSPKQTAVSKGGLPFWVKILAILVVAFIVFLVFKNMESDPAGDAPDIPDHLNIKV